MKKLREFCKVFPRISRDINLCDGAAASIFSNDDDRCPYLFSNTIEKGYGVDEKYLTLKNDWTFPSLSSQRHEILFSSIFISVMAIIRYSLVM